MAMKSISILSLFFFPFGASAQVIVSEIMYDLEGGDADREWIEVHNEGSETVTLTDWKLFENKTNHGITATAGETLSPGAYAVIADDAAQFKNDWPSYTGLLFDSAFSLNNTGETLTLRCCGKDLADKDMFSYASEQGGAGDGMTLHRSGSITAGKPSPGTGAIVQTTPPPPPVETPKPVAPPVPAPMHTAPATTTAHTAALQSPPAPSETVQSIPVVPQVVATAVSQQNVQEEPYSPAPKPKAKPKKKATPPPEMIEEEEPVVIAEKEAPQKPNEAQVAAASQVLPRGENKWLWLSGALAVSLLGAYGAFTLGKVQGRKKEWEIEEID